MGSTNNHLPIITLLRAIASLGVCAVHLHFATPLFKLPIGKILGYGMHGVAIFFVISGFVIPYSLWNSNYQVKNFFGYILRRSVRIDPPYIAAIIICLIFGLFFGNYKFDLLKLIFHLLYLIPFTEYSWYQGVFWTLGIEFQFYLLIGVLFPLLRKNVTAIVVSLLLIGATGYLLPFGDDSTFIFRHVHFFCMGLFILLYKKERLSIIKLHLVIAALAIYICLNISFTTGLIGYFTCLAIIHLNFTSHLSNFLGKISYSLYLTHLLTAELLLYFLKGITINPYILFLTLLSGAILVSYLFYLCVERPSITFSKKIEVGK